MVLFFVVLPCGGVVFFVVMLVYVFPWFFFLVLAYLFGVVW